MSLLSIKILPILLLIIISNCTKSDLVIRSNPQLDIMNFDVVEKKLFLIDGLSENVTNLLQTWFNDKVKVNGYEGIITFNITNYTETITQIDNGKRIDISLSFNALIEKPSLTQKKIIKGSVNTYGSITGNYSLRDFDGIIYNTQTDLILRLSRDLKSKI